MSNCDLSAYPRPRLGRQRGNAGCRRLLSSFTSLHTLGRAALYWAFRGLNLKQGATVWMPSLHCGVEVQAAIEAGLTVRFYGIRNDLTFDPTEVIARVNQSPGPVLVIHYFGFPQPYIRELANECSARGWILIEDCAHALLSTDSCRSLGDYGSISIFSLRKTLPIYHGGALKVDHDAVHAITGKWFVRPSLSRFPFRRYSQFLKREVAEFGGGTLVSVMNKIRNQPKPRPGELAPESLRQQPVRDYQLSGLCHAMAQAASPVEIVRRRRENYLLLESILDKYSGFKKVFGNGLNAGVSPLCFPIMVGNRREILIELHKGSIRPYVFGAFPHPCLPLEECTATAEMRNAIMGLPIHQQLHAEEVIRIGEIVGKSATKLIEALTAA
jgi:dTDP-4-amino-4,6-dideoxygalactose transaminase